MRTDAKASLFLMLGQTAERALKLTPEILPDEALYISSSYNLANYLPEVVKGAIRASYAYKLFFVFEAYLRELVKDVLSNDSASQWWDKIPPDVQSEVAKLEETEETKSWMALGSRDKSALMTFPQLIRVIDHCWKFGFEDLLRDKSLIQEARFLSHLRNTICHMTEISDEELERITQTMRDWFRVVAP